MDLSTVHQGVHKLKRKKRVGRGPGSGHGKTAIARQQGPVGQRRRQEAARRCSKAARCRCSAAFPSAASATPPGTRHYHVVNVGDLDKAFDDGDTVDPEALRKAGLAKGPADGVRILGHGRADQAAGGRGAPLLEVGGREDRGQGRHGRGHPAAQEAGNATR